MARLLALANEKVNIKEVDKTINIAKEIIEVAGVQEKQEKQLTLKDIDSTLFIPQYTPYPSIFQESTPKMANT